MVDSQEGFPDPESIGGPNILSKEALFTLLATSGLAELGTSDRVTVVQIDNTPKDTGELYLNPEGKPVYGFMMKFSEGFTGWKQGDLVRARFVVRTKAGAGEVSLLVADSYVGDVRNADEFVLQGKPEELAKLRALGITELDLDVEVTSKDSDYIVSNMFRYSGRVDRVNSILTAWDGESELTPGQVLLQGTVKEYVADTDNSYTDRRPTYMTVDVNGKPVVIDMSSGHIAYDGSRYEKLLSEVPEAGDVVQVLASYNPNFTQSRYGRERVSAFTAGWCRSTYCLAPSPDRATAQESFHKSVETMLSELAGITDPVAFRQQYGKIIDLSFVNADTSAKDCRTIAQQKRMSELVDAMFGEDHMEKPLLAVGKDFASVYSTFKKEFGMDLYTMSVSEVHTAVLEIARDPSKLDPKDVNVDYLYRVLDDALTPEQMSILAKTVIDTYYPITVRKGRLFEKEGYVPEPGKVPSNQYSITEHAIIELSQTGLDSDVETLTALFENSITNDMFAHVRGEGDYIYKIADSLEYALNRAGTWSPEKGWYGVSDRARLQLFTQTILPRLFVAMEQYTTKINALPYVDGEKFANISHSITRDPLRRMAKTASQLETFIA